MYNAGYILSSLSFLPPILLPICSTETHQLGQLLRRPKPRIVRLAPLLDRLLVRLGEGVDESCGIAAPHRVARYDSAVRQHSVGEDDGVVLQNRELALAVSYEQRSYS